MTERTESGTHWGPGAAERSERLIVGCAAAAFLVVAGGLFADGSLPTRMAILILAGCALALLALSHRLLRTVRTDSPLTALGGDLPEYGAERMPAAPSSPSLRNPVDLHFLCNALNCIAGLSDEAPERVPDFASKLATVLRGTLGPSPGEMVSLSHELEWLKAFLSIQKTRFGERFDFEVHVDGDIGSCRLPESVVLPLIGNAQHGGARRGEPVRIVVSAFVADGRLALSIRTAGTLRESAAEGREAGYQLVGRRLAEVYGDRQTFSLRESDGWVVAEMTLPCGGAPQPGLRTEML